MIFFLRSLPFFYLIAVIVKSSYWKTALFLSIQQSPKDNSSLDENFFDFLKRCQGNRMDDQRCELPKPSKPAKTKLVSGRFKHKMKFGRSNSAEDLLEMLARVQGNRMDEQRSANPNEEESISGSKASKYRVF